jgi:hypothetical protein
MLRGMRAFVISGFVTLFAFLFSWSEIIREFVGKRTRMMLAVASAVSMWVAFTYAPEQAMGIIRAPLDGIEARAIDWFQDSVRDMAQSTTEP